MRFRAFANRSRGALLLEAVAAALVLFAAMGATIRLLSVMVDSRRQTDHRQFAIEAAANVMERIAALPAEERTAERLDRITLDPEAARRLPEGRLRVALSDPGANDPNGLGRLIVEVRWRGASGRDEAPVRLTAWLARPGRER